MSIVLNGTTGITTPDIDSTQSTLGPLTQALNLGSTGQIVFPATQNASANANTLDDYEEGTWTPALATSSTQPTVSYAQQQGHYIKVGRMVYATFFLQVNSVSAQGSGNLRISGLPFTQVSNSSRENGAVFYVGAVFGYTDINQLTGRGISATQILISTLETNGAVTTRNTGTLTAGFIGGSYSYLAAS